MLHKVKMQQRRGMVKLHKVIDLDDKAIEFFRSAKCEDLRRRGASMRRFGLPRRLVADGPLAGELAHFSALQLLQILEPSRKTGVIELIDVRGSGRIGIIDGRICSAVSSYLPPGSAEKALLRMILMEAGHFAFSPEHPREIQEEIKRFPTMHWLMKAMRHFDEVSKLMADERVSFSSCIRRSLTSDNLDIKDPDFYSAALSAGSVVGLLDAWPETDLDTLRKLVELRREEHVEVGSL